MKHVILMLECHTAASNKAAKFTSVAIWLEISHIVFASKLQ